MSDEEMESSEQEGGGSAAAQEQKWATENLALRAEARKQKTESKSPVEGLKNAEKQIQKIQKILRVINGASAATLVGIIITFIIMNLQLIFGNGLKVRFVPVLAFWEILLLALVDALILIQLIFLSAYYGVIIYAAACLSGYWDVAKCAWGVL